MAADNSSAVGLAFFSSTSFLLPTFPADAPLLEYRVILPYIPCSNPILGQTQFRVLNPKEIRSRWRYSAIRERGRERSGREKRRVENSCFTSRHETGASSNTRSGVGHEISIQVRCHLLNIHEHPSSGNKRLFLKITTEEKRKKNNLEMHITWSWILRKLTITSNCSGFETSCMQQLSTMISSYLMPGYLVAISRQDSKNSPSASFMILAL